MINIHFICTAKPLPIYITVNFLKISSQETLSLRTKSTHLDLPKEPNHAELYSRTKKCMAELYGRTKNLLHWWRVTDQEHSSVSS